VSVRGSLRAAVRDFYAQSWRLLILNAALAAFVAAVLVAGAFFPPAFALLVVAGPLAGALMHCIVRFTQTDELSLRDATAGLRLHWRRGLALGALALAVAAAALVAVPFYARLGGWAWSLAVLALYLAALFAALQVVVWPLAVFDADRPLADVLRAGLAILLRRPLAVGTLAFALLAINAAGAAAAAAPFLTLTVAYSFLAAARFALPRPEPGETAAWPA